MHVRGYEDRDAVETLAVFTRAVNLTACRDYTPRQLQAWLGDSHDLDKWCCARTAANTQVAKTGGRVVGFIDIADDGYIDMLFVDPGHGRQGIGSALLGWAERTAREAGAVQLSTQASITARSFFEQHGFVVDEELAPERNGVVLVNYRMTAQLEEHGPR